MLLIQSARFFSNLLDYNSLQPFTTSLESDSQNVGKVRATGEYALVFLDILIISYLQKNKLEMPR